jgi:ribosomal-protein-alanine N-acetyltransferase
MLACRVWFRRPLRPVPRRSLPTGSSGRGFMSYAAVVEAFCDPEIQRWHARRADSISHSTAWFDRSRSSWASESESHWAIPDPNSNALLGRVSLMGVNLQDGTADLAY